VLVSATLFRFSYGSSILDSQHRVYYFLFCILCIIDSALLIALLHFAFHLVQRYNTAVGDTDSGFLQEYVNEISISPLWQWCPTVTPQATSCDWQVGERYKYNPPQCCPGGRKNKHSAAREQERASWCRAAESCVGQLMQDLSTGRDVILQHSFLFHLKTWEFK